LKNGLAVTINVQVSAYEKDANDPNPEIYQIAGNLQEHSEEIGVGSNFSVGEIQNTEVRVCPTDKTPANR
jgi:hypothetical protein